MRGCFMPSLLLLWLERRKGPQLSVFIFYVSPVEGSPWLMQPVWLLVSVSHATLGYVLSFCFPLSTCKGESSSCVSQCGQRPNVRPQQLNRKGPGPEPAGGVGHALFALYVTSHTLFTCSSGKVRSWNTFSIHGLRKGWLRSRDTFLFLSHLPFLIEEAQNSWVPCFSDDWWSHWKSFQHLSACSPLQRSYSHEISKLRRPMITNKVH